MATKKKITVVGKKKKRAIGSRPTKKVCLNDIEIKDTEMCEGRECEMYNKCCQPKKKKTDDDAIMEITEMHIKDASGNIQVHKAEVNEDWCDSNAGDYLPGDPICDAPCPLRNVCVLNARHFGRIEISDDEFEDLKADVKATFYDQYVAHKKLWDRSQYGTGKSARKEHKRKMKSEHEPSGFLAKHVK